MNMDQAAVFLAGSILTVIGFVVVVAGVVTINNIIHKYWKPIRIFTPDSWHPFSTPPVRYATDEELARIAPHLSEDKSK